jgi:hypothetical protein
MVFPEIKKTYFFLCLFLRKRFFRLCVAILCLFLFFPLGMIKYFLNEQQFI